MSALQLRRVRADVLISRDAGSCPPLAGEVCCPDAQHHRVAVGLGDACCGRMPYSTVGAQLCCAGRLRDGHGQQCCGGQLVSREAQCCGGADEGVAYSRLPGEGPRLPFSNGADEKQIQ